MSAALKPIAIAEDLRARIIATLERDNLAQSTVAREAGFSGSALSQWLQGKYAAATAELDAKLARWLEAYERRKREQARLPAAPGYVETPTGSRVIDALAYAQLAGDIAVVYGGAGLGKSQGCAAYQERNPCVWIATMTPATASIATALEEIADALRLPDGAGGAARLQRAIVKRLRGTGGLLVVDEAQHLSVAALDELRSLHDASGIGLALVGNETVYARLTGGTRAAYLDRLYSRIGKRVRLARTVKGDVDAIARAWNVTERDTLVLLADIAGKPGALRGVTKCLRLAALLAAADSEALGVRHLRAAWTDLGGEI